MPIIIIFDDLFLYFLVRQSLKLWSSFSTIIKTCDKRIA